MKIIASDFDGTLACRGGISDEDRHAIEAFRRAGHKFGIVTGRDMPMALDIVERHNFHPDFLICCTGATILGEDGRVLYHKRGKLGNFMNEIFAHACAMGARLFTVNDGPLKYFADVSGGIPFDLSPFTAFTQVNVHFSDSESAEAFATLVRERYSRCISAHRNGRDVDMPPPDTSKVTGIYEYAKRFDAPQIYTVGDNVNDLSMIREFCGYAVENAVDAVKAEADHLCRRVADMIDDILREE